MIIFLYGQDTYRLRQKLNEIIEHYKKINKSGLSLAFLDGQDLEFQDFKNQTETVSMFREKKLIIIESIFSNQKFKENFLRQGEKFKKSDNIILITEEKEIAANDSLFRFLKKNSQFQEFKTLEGEKFKNWVKKELNNHRAEITEGALEKLIDFVDNNLWQMVNEIKKLVNYTQGKKIQVTDIELLVKPKIEADIFRTIDAISEKKKKLALSLVHKHLEKGDSPLYLLRMINFQFRNLMMIKSYELRPGLYVNYMRILSQKLGLHPFVVRKSIQQARKFTLIELKKIYQKIFEVDFNIKTGRIDPEVALDLLITEI